MIRNHINLLAACLAVCFCVVSAAQSSPNLRAFFEKRLADAPNTPPPSYEALLAVIDTIKAAPPPGELQNALPLLSAALRSTVPNVPLEAAFALLSISHRADGAAILKDQLPEVATLLTNSDERLSGGAVMMLRMLSRSNSEMTVPLLVSELQRPGKPSVIKSSIVSVLLESPRRNNDNVLRAIERYLTAGADDPRVRLANIQAIAANHVATPVFVNYVVAGLSDWDEQVQMAAIQASYALGNDVRTRARPFWNKLASDTSAHEKVRYLARRALDNQLQSPDKAPEPPAPPKVLRGEP